LRQSNLREGINEYEFVTVLIVTSILTIYHIHNDEAELLKIEFIEGNGKTVGVFSETSREFWIVDSGFCGQKFVIQPGDPDPFYRSRLCRLCPGSKLGAPTVCECACNKLLVGTDTGNLVACDWFGELPVTCELSHKPINSLSLSPDHTLCLVSDTDGEVCVVNVESYEAKRLAGKSVKVKFISPTALLENSGKELSHRAAANFDILSAPSALDHLLLKSLEESRRLVLEELRKPMTATQLAECARRHGHEFLGDLFETLDRERFAVISAETSNSDRIIRWCRTAEPI
jgi:hypothetical protein